MWRLLYIGRMRLRGMKSVLLGVYGGEWDVVLGIFFEGGG